MKNSFANLTLMLKVSYLSFKFKVAVCRKFGCLGDTLERGVKITGTHSSSGWVETLKANHAKDTLEQKSVNSAGKLIVEIHSTKRRKDGQAVVDRCFV
jgi:hypothetical protein